LLFFVGTSHSAGQVVVGSKVGIGDIVEAQSRGLLLPSVFGGIIQPFQVDGVFDISGFHVFSCIIEVKGQSELVIDNANVDFFGSTIRHTGPNFGSSLNIRNSAVKLQRSSVAFFNDIVVDEGSTVDITQSIVEDNFMLQIRDNGNPSSLNISFSTVSNCLIDFYSGGELRISNCTIKDNPRSLVVFKGNYTGRNNIWTNNIGSDLRVSYREEDSSRIFSEIGSTFFTTSASNYHVLVTNAWDVTIQDCFFNSASDLAIDISRSNNKVKVEEVSIDGCRSGVRIRNCSGRECSIKDVKLRNMNSNGVGVSVAGNAVSPILELIDIENCLLSRGVQADGNAPNMTLRGSSISGCDFGFLGNSNESCFTLDNTFTSSKLIGARVNNSNFHIHSCNTYIGNPVGFELGGNAGGLDLRGNTFFFNEVGLQYAADANGTPQIERGNVFYSSTNLDAQMLGFGGPQRIDGNQHVLNAGIPAEQASSNHVDWFVPLGTKSFLCGVNSFNNGSGGSGLTGYVKYLFACLDSTTIDCYCYLNQKAALLVINDHPEVLNDPFVDSIYHVISGTVVGQLPTISDLLVATNIIASVSFDTIAMASDTTFANAIEVTLANQERDDLVAEAMLLRAEVIDSVRESLDVVSVGEDETCALYEMEMLHYLLDVVAQDSITDEVAVKVINTAESCLSDNGMAVYIAQTIARMQGLSFTDNDGCEVTSRSSNSSADVSVEISISPNPASSEIIAVGISDGRQLVYDMQGRSYSLYADGGRIDIRILPSGIYTMLDNVSGRSARFIKID
jgi:hypothetical protein